MVKDGNGSKGGHRGGRFDIRITYSMIVAAARDRRAIHYKGIADAHGLEMMRVFNQLNHHLGKVLQISFERKWPALTAVIVPKRPGYLTGKSLNGFCESAIEAGYEFDDCETFAREQMEAVFDWAQTADGEWK